MKHGNATVRPKKTGLGYQHRGNKGRSSMEETREERPDGQKEKRRRKRLRALRTFLIRLAALAAVGYVLFFHIVGIMMMPSGDMYPRLDAGDLLLFYRVNRKPKAQEIAVFHKTVNENGKETVRTYVCRVIATTGDTVEISPEGGLQINGNTVVETNIFYPTKEYAGFMDYPIRLSDGEYFVLADFRNGGEDSRYFGPVKQDEMDGILFTVLRRNNL